MWGCMMPPPSIFTRHWRIFRPKVPVFLCRGDLARIYVGLGEALYEKKKSGIHGVAG